MKNEFEKIILFYILSFFCLSACKESTVDPSSNNRFQINPTPNNSSSDVNASKFTDDEIYSWSKNDIENLSLDQVTKISFDQMKLLSSFQLKLFNILQIGKFSYEQFKALALKESKASLKDIQAFDLLSIDRNFFKRLEELSPFEQFYALTPFQFEFLVKNVFQNEQIINYFPSLIYNLYNHRLKKNFLEKEILDSGIEPAHKISILSQMNSQHSLSIENEWISKNDENYLSPDQVQEIYNYAWKESALSAEKWTPEFISSIDDDKIQFIWSLPVLTKTQIQAFTDEHLSCFSADQLNLLSVDQISYLTESQKKVILDNKKISKNLKLSFYE